MVSAARRVAELVSRTSVEQFASDWVIQNGLIRELEIMGEAAGRVSRELAETHPDIPWREITGIRHKLIHDYFEVDLEVVWRTATENVPAVLGSLEAVLAALEADEASGAAG